MTDQAQTWAVEREAQLRLRSYREAMLWENGVAEALEMNPVFKCVDPEGAWIQTVREEMHSVRVDLYDEGAAT